MNVDTSFLAYFINASLMVKCVMLILAGASIVSWSYILQDSSYLNAIRKRSVQFEELFWSGEDLSELYAEGAKHKNALTGMQAIFQAGFKEFLRFRDKPDASKERVLANTKRAMLVVQMREQEKLETHLPFLAIVGSVSPYVGLFGTVWGIMVALRALANAQQATISMVAPGMAEALIATALGLFAAIPAVIAYNRFISGIGRLMNRYDAFQQEFTNILIRQ